MNQKYLLVTADYNDGDYTSLCSPITDERLQQLRPVIEAIKNFEPYTITIEGWSRTYSNNYPNNNYYDEDEDEGDEQTPEKLYGHFGKAFQIFDDEYVPCHEYGIHTIESIEVIQILEKLI